MDNDSDKSQYAMAFDVYMQYVRAIENKPAPAAAQQMCAEVELRTVAPSGDVMVAVLEKLRRDRSNGGVLMVGLHVGESTTFDWFSSRNRLMEYDILFRLLRRQEVRDALPTLHLPDRVPDIEAEDGFCYGDRLSHTNGFDDTSVFELDGTIAHALYFGGCYPPSEKMQGREAKRLAMEFCEEWFGLRYEDVSLYTTHQPWTPWFGNISPTLDWTALLFDKRERTLWIVAVTDTD